MLHIAIVITFIIIVIGMFTVYYQEQEFQQHLELKIERTLQQLATVLKSPIWDVNFAQIQEIIRSYLQDPDILAIRVVDSIDNTFYFGKDPDTRDVIDLSQTADQEISYPDKFQPKTSTKIDILFEGDAIGACEVIFSRQFITNQSQTIKIAISIALIVLLSLETLVILWLVRRDISSPLKTVMYIAQQFAQGDLHCSLRFKSSRSQEGQDEIATLLQGFQEMTVYLQQMAALATSISQGDFKRNITPKSEKDQLGNAFHNMATYLHEIASTTEAIANGDLTRTIHVRSERDTLGQAVETMTKGLYVLILQIRSSAEQITETGNTITSLSDHDTEIVHTVQSSVDEMTSTMNQMGERVEDVAQNMDLLSASVEATSVSVSQMTSSVGTIATNTTDLAQRTEQTINDLHTIVRTLEDVTEETNVSSQLSQETMEEARAGQDAVEQVKASMDMIQRTNQNAVETITRFEQQSREIGTILDVIHDITEQSALLALNASIIAAQAGEHGRGFSVIADEMRNLANEVNNSAKGIGTIVQTIQQEITKVVRMIHENTSQINQGADRTTQARERLHKIISSAERSSEVISKIASVLHEQRESSHGVMTEITEVNSMTSEITSATSEQKSSTQQIDEAMQRIRDMAIGTQQATREQSSYVQDMLQTATSVNTLTGQNLDSSKQINQATRVELVSQAQRLLESVDQFRLGGEKSGS